MANLVAPEVGLNPVSSKPISLPSLQAIPDVSRFTDFRPQIAEAGAKIATSIDTYLVNQDKVEGENIANSMKMEQEKVIQDYQSNPQKWTKEEAAKVKAKLYDLHSKAWNKVQELDPRVQPNWVKNENTYAMQLISDYNTVTTKRKASADMTTLSTSLSLTLEQFSRSYGNVKLRDTIRRDQLDPIISQIATLSGMDEKDAEVFKRDTYSKALLNIGQEAILNGNIGQAKYILQKEDLNIEQRISLERAIKSAEEVAARNRQTKELKEAINQWKLANGKLSDEQQAQLNSKLYWDNLEQIKNNHPDWTKDQQSEYAQYLTNSQWAQIQQENNIKRTDGGSWALNVVADLKKAALSNNIRLDKEFLTAQGPQGLAIILADYYRLDGEERTGFLANFMSRYEDLDKDLKGAIESYALDETSITNTQARSVWDTSTSKEKYVYLSDEVEKGKSLFDALNELGLSAKEISTWMKNYNSYSNDKNFQATQNSVQKMVYENTYFNASNKTKPGQSSKAWIPESLKTAVETDDIAYNNRVLGQYRENLENIFVEKIKDYVDNAQKKGDDRSPDVIWNEGLNSLFKLNVTERTALCEQAVQQTLQQLN